MFLEVYEPAGPDTFRSLGVLAGAQVKSGRTAFGRPVHGADGEPTGWWFGFRGKKYHDEWLQQSHLQFVVLVDLDKGVAYWEAVTRQTAVGTGAGWKIFVAASQRVEPAQIQDMVAAVLEHRRRSLTFHGSGWVTGDAGEPSRPLWRRVCTVPRLLAPHRNVGYSFAIRPPAAAALAVLGRQLDYRRFLEQHPVDKSDWSWRLVDALVEMHAGGPVDGLDHMADAAPEHGMVICQVLRACEMLRREQPKDAAEGLLQALEMPELAPADHGWLELHLARSMYELGAFDEAGQHAESAVLRLETSTEPDEAAIATAAGNLLWRLRDAPGGAEFAAVMKRADQPHNWWRSDLFATVGEAATEEAFHRATSAPWERRYVSEDEGHAALSGASLIAEVTGDHGAANATESLHARQHLSDLQPHTEQSEEAAFALNALRRAGDAQSLGRAAAAIARTGPLKPLCRALSISLETPKWTTTSAHTTLELWQRAGHLLAPDDAAGAIAVCMETLRDDRTIPEPRLGSWSVSYELMRALAGLLPAAPAESHELVLRWLLDRRDAPLSLELLAAREIIQRIHWGAATPELVSDTLLWAASAAGDTGKGNDDNDQSEAKNLALSCIAAAGDHSALHTLQTRAFDDLDLDALATLAARGLATGVIPAHAMVGKLAGLSQPEQQDGKRTVSVGGHDPIALLSWLNLQRVDEADWATVRSALLDPTGASRHDGVAAYLARRVDDLPEEFVQELRTKIPALVNDEEPEPEEWAFFEEATETGMVALGLALGAWAADEALERVLAFARARKPSVRTHAPELAWHARSTIPSTQVEAIVFALANDQDVFVRRDAHKIAARQVAGSPEPPPLMEQVVAAGLGDHGVLVPLGCLHGLTTGQVPARLLAAVEQLAQHPSAFVRLQALALSDPSREKA